MLRPSKAGLFSGGVQPPSLWSESSPDECEETCRHGKPHWGVVGALQDSSICFPFLVSRFAIPKAQSGCFKWLAYVGMLAPFPGFLGWYRHRARWWHYMLRRKGILNLNRPNRLPLFLRGGTTQSLCYVHPDFFKDLIIIQDVWSNQIRHLLYGC